MHRPFRFNPDTAIQAVAFFLRRERGHRMNYMRVLKLLYIAEREILAEFGVPLTGSPVVAMRRGPVLEDVYSLIRSQHHETPRWASYFQVGNFDLEMIDDPGVGKLPKFFTAKLEEVARRHAQHDEWDMVEIVHELPEWKKNDPADSSRRIPLADILEAVGRSKDEASILESARQDKWRQAFFSESESAETDC